MHRPLIIVVALLGLGILSFFMTGGFQPVETTGVRPSEIATGQPRQSTVPAPSDTAEVETATDTTADESVVVETAQIATDEPVSDAPVDEDIVVAAPAAPSNPEVVNTPERTAVAVVTPPISLSDVIASANQAEPADTQDEVPLSDAPVIAVFEAPVATVDVTSLEAPSFSGIELSAVVEETPTRSRSPIALEGLGGAQDVTAVSIETQSAPLPTVSEKPAEEVAVFASRSSGSLLLTATALGADGVLRPSAVGSLQGVTPADEDAPIDITNLAPAPRPTTSGATESTVAQSVVSFLNSGALPSADTLLTNHIVRPGDTLAKMAVQYYGDREAFIHIYNANRDVLARPEQIRIGQSLRIPVVPGYN